MALRFFFRGKSEIMFSSLGVSAASFWVGLVTLLVLAVVVVVVVEVVVVDDVYHHHDQYHLGDHDHQLRL